MPGCPPTSSSTPPTTLVEGVKSSTLALKRTCKPSISLFRAAKKEMDESESDSISKSSEESDTKKVEGEQIKPFDIDSSIEEESKDMEGGEDEEDPPENVSQGSYTLGLQTCRIQ